MIRELFVATAITATALSTAVSAAADPRHYDTDVPGMSYDASAGAPCDSWERFVFGRGPGGQAMACHWIPNQFPAPPQVVDTGFWVISYPLHGVQEIGAPCPGPQSAAQSPDGLEMVCMGARG